jgi:hypothetical protein
VSLRDHSARHGHNDKDKEKKKKKRRWLARVARVDATEK